MAVRDSQHAFQVLFKPSTRNVRDSQNIFQILFKPSTRSVRDSQNIFQVLFKPPTRNVRDSQHIFQVLFKIVTNPDLSDSLNNWNDSLSISFKDYYLNLTDNLNSWDDNLNIVLNLRNTPLGDSINSWNDNLTLQFLAAFLLLTRAVADDLANAVKKGPVFTYSWKDGIGFVLRPEGPVDIQLDDLEAFLADELAIGIGLIIGDDLSNWDDSIANIYGLTTEAFDSMFYNINDELTVVLSFSTLFNDNLNNWLDTVSPNLLQPLLTQLLSDGLNNWNDLIIVSFILQRLISDNLIQADEIRTRLTTKGGFSDSLSLSDNLGINLGISNAYSDDLNNWNDSLNILIPIIQTISLADSMSLSDAIIAKNRETDEGYLRRYLNDL